MQESTNPTVAAWQIGIPERDEGDDTQPLRIISSRVPHSGIPFKPRGTWFKKPQPSDPRRTPEFTEIGDPAA